MSQLSLFPKPRLSPSEQLRLERAEQQAFRDKRNHELSRLQDQWGGFWGAQFIDGHSVFGPGTTVYLLGGKPLKIARVEAEPGKSDHARLTCIYTTNEEMLPIWQLTDKLLKKRKTDVFIPRSLFSEQGCAEHSLRWQQQYNKAIKQNKPWSIPELRTFIIDHFKQSYWGVANQIIWHCQGYKEDTEAFQERHQINWEAQQVQMKLLASCRKYDPDDFLAVFYQVVDEIAENHVRTATYIQIE